MVSVIEQRMTRLVSLKFSGVTAANAPRPMRELEWNIRDDDTTVLPGKVTTFMSIISYRHCRRRYRRNRTIRSGAACRARRQTTAPGATSLLARSQTVSRNQTSFANWLRFMELQSRLAPFDGKSLSGAFKNNAYHAMIETTI